MGEAIRESIILVEEKWSRLKHKHTVYQVEEIMRETQRSLVGLISKIYNVDTGVVEYNWHCEKYGEVDV